jgi:hypothetical protein
MRSIANDLSHIEYGILHVDTLGRSLKKLLDSRDRIKEPEPIRNRFGPRRNEPEQQHVAVLWPALKAPAPNRRVGARSGAAPFFASGRTLG